MTKRVCNYRYQHVASVRLLLFVSIHSYYRGQRRIDCRLVMLYKVLSQSQPPIISLQTVGSPDTSTLWYTDRHPHSRTTINTPSFPEQSYIGISSQPAIPQIFNLAHFSNFVCQVVHLSPKVSDSVFIF